jgi:hypothetical protein
MTVIELPDEQAAALKTKANAAGLTLEAWLQQLAAEQQPLPNRPHRHIADVICENMRACPRMAPVSMTITFTAGPRKRHDRAFRRHVLLNCPRGFQ